jgi:cystathionine beta-synthase
VSWRLLYWCAGGSAGSAMVGALHAARSLKAGQRCVVLLADGVRNYMTKFLNNEWMWQFGCVLVCVAAVVSSLCVWVVGLISAWWSWRLCLHSYVDPSIGVGTSDRTALGAWADHVVADLKPRVPFTVLPTVTCKEAIDILSGEGFDQLPVVSAV